MQDHSGIPHKVARSFCADQAAHDDLVQEIHIAVWHAVPGFSAGSKPSSYIYRIALNRAISWKRKENTYRKNVAEFESEAIPAASGPPAHDPRLELVYTEIRRLNKAERALILMQLDGFNYDEIAAALGLSTSNVGARLTRIRQKLAANLKDK